MERHAIEKHLLQKIDNDAAQIRAKILTGKLDQLTRAESSAWAIFLSSMRLRQPHLVNDLKVQAEQHLREQLRNWQDDFTTIQHEAGLPSLEDWTENRFPGVIENFGLSFFAELVGNRDIQARLLSLDWWIWSGDRAGREVILSDHPCIFTTGINDPNNIIVFPLSPTKVFVATENRTIAAKLRSQPARELAIRINESSVNQARVRLYATNRTPHRFILNRLHRNGRLPATIKRN